MNLFLWGALPYIAFTFLIVGTLVRFFYFERNWTTKSSQFLEKKQLRIANPVFHFGLLCVIAGHVVGILIPKTWTAAIGINDHMYHEGALYMGVVAGIIIIVGFLLLMKRRFTVAELQVNTSRLDKWLYLFLTLAIFSGMAGTLLNASGLFDYRVSVGPWFRSLLAFMPDPSLMEGAPFMFKFHMLTWMVVAIIFPFSRLVHCLSAPLNYLTRPFIVYRKRDEK
ncbi:respiratory nitrate reductase subunit gamma [uncultured Veillonella sp.]|uniref:respiratory nitrate reductase subunit gamma n=1 Tax=uncultured Veillonella sp. TaxID=159268 RepID=UPI0028DC0D19|nr:respiratory nitrate reductase subunit gamma [uncultured Veillonella sp.]